MPPFLRLLLREGTASFLALLVLIGLVLAAGESAEINKRFPLDQWRIPIVIGLLVVWLAAWITQRVLAVRAAIAIERRLRKESENQLESTRPEQRPEVQELQKRLDDAVLTLKRSRLGKSALYRLPWYILIGPPHSGKTTALSESGLNFPYANQGSLKLKGVGGTRNCDWWFTDQGILLDTAGRYTTELEDRDEWLAFLDMLRRSRKHKPINGAIVAIDVAHLLAANEEEANDYVQKVRARLDELTKRLELLFPVYVLFTKVDLLEGFVDFFGELNADQRAEIWGCTLDAGDQRPLGEAFVQETRALFDALCTRRVQLLATQRQMDAKERIHAFPLQFALTIPRLERFLTQLFQANPFEEGAKLRGFYFTSGTQEGTPIDQLVSALAQATKVATPAGRPPLERKSYFLKHLFQRVIFTDQGLARRSTRIEQRRQLLHRAGAITAIAAGVLLCAGMIVSCVKNWALVDGHKNALELVHADIKKGPPRDRDDFEMQLAHLDDLHARILSLEQVPLSSRFGLSHAGHLQDVLLQRYHRQLRTLFVQPMLEELQRRLAAPERDRDTNDPPGAFAHAATSLVFLGKLPPAGGFLGEVLDNDRQGLWALAAEQVRGQPPDEHLRKRVAHHAAALVERLRDARSTPPELVMEETGTAETYAGRLQTQGPRWAYADLVASFEAETRVSLETLMPEDARQSQWLESRYTFSQCFEKGRWTEFQSRAERKAAVLADVGTSLQLDREQWSRDTLRKTFVDRYRNDARDHWRDLAKSIEPTRYANVGKAVAGMRQLADPDGSPILRVFKAIRARRHEPDWKQDPKLEEMLTKSLSFLAKLREPLEKFDTGSDDAKVLAAIKNGALTELDTTCSAISKDVAAALEGTTKVDQDPDKSAIQNVIENVLLRARAAVRAAATEEFVRRWDRTVAEPFAKNLAGKFPFDANSLQSVDPKDLVTILHPRTGTLVGQCAAIEQYRKEIRKGVPVIGFADDCDGRIGRLTDVSRALFSGDDLKLRFALCLYQYSGTHEVGFLWNKGEISSTNNAGDTWLELMQSEGLGEITLFAYVGQKGPDTKVRVFHSADAWFGVFRMLGELQRGRTDGPQMSFSDKRKAITARTAGAAIDYSFGIRVTCKADPNPFAQGFFNFPCPAGRDLLAVVPSNGDEAPK